MSDSSNASTSSLALLAIDALTEFERVVDAVPAPGRGGAIGRLNPAWWTVLHVIRQADFVQSFATGGKRDPWLVERGDDETAPPFDEVRAALAERDRRELPMATELIKLMVARAERIQRGFSTYDDIKTTSTRHRDDDHGDDADEDPESDFSSDFDSQDDERACGAS